MPALGNHLNFAQYEARNMAVHNGNPNPPSGNVKGQLWFNNVSNELFYWDGTIWQSAKSGVGTGGPPTGAASGDLTGSYPGPQIAAGVIVDADVNGSAAIAESKLSLATDAAVGTGSRRTLGSGAQQAMPGNRTLDAIATPVNPVNVNGQKITSLSTPTASTDAANKLYVDNAAQGLDAKASVRVATTGNVALSGALSTIDGVTMVNGDRVLVKSQTTPAENGIYTWAAPGDLTRATDMDTWLEVPNAYVWVEVGTANADTGWVCTADQGGTLNSTAVTWVQFSSAAGITAGAGLTKTGNTLDVGAGTGMTINADDIALTVPVTVANGGTGQTTAKAARETGLGGAGYYSSATHGAGTTITITQATHGLRASKGLIVQVRDEATGAWELPDHTVAANGDVTVTFGASVSANSKRVTVVG